MPEVNITPASSPRSEASRPIRGATRSAALHITFQDSDAAAGYALALASLFVGAADSVVAVDVHGRNRDDLDLTELRERLKAHGVASIRIDLRLGARVVQVAVRVGAPDNPGAVFLSLPFVDDARGALALWLQADSLHLGPLPLLMLPVVDGAFPIDALHPLVAVAAHSTSFASAELQIDGDAGPRATWTSDKANDGDRPVVGADHGSRWSTDLLDADEPVAWFADRAPEEGAPRLSVEWLRRLHEVVSERATVDVIEAHLRAAQLDLPPLHVVDHALAPAGPFMVPPEHGVVASLHPRDRDVLVAVDFRQPAALVKSALLHALAHLALGHVRPGDEAGHWDTENTLSSAAASRTWDRDAQCFLSEELVAQPARRVESLAECTPTERAELGLWKMIGEMLGESRRLHPAATRYQQAAYQRQAAERLVSMLEDLGGAMLCDGVGLGKTYVATTVIVHYINEWRDQWASSPERLTEDPFRITVVAPHSVVSTWRREALPGLAAFGVPLASVRVVSHTQFSRVVRASDVLEAVGGAASDVEHLLLSDLVIVDEAHNFRSLAARRTKVLRDLLRLQPRRDLRRRVLLLTATPINNSLDDLRQEVSLLFSRPLSLSNAKTEDGYRRQAVTEIQERCTRARSTRARGDVAPLLAYGNPEARFSDGIEFRADIPLGPDLRDLNDYLKRQDKRLKELQDEVRLASQTPAERDSRSPVRIAEELLDRVVVQRSRALCKEIERQQSSTVELLFRPDAGVPEKLHYSDEYDGIEDVLAGFLPLFGGGDQATAQPKRPALSFKIYMWYDVREGLKTADDTSSVVGLQRVLVLKRLESSPVSFLITLLRLTVLHAHRLQQLGALCLRVGDKERGRELQTVLDQLLVRQVDTALAKIRSLATGSAPADPRTDFFASLSAAYSADRPAADPDDPPPQLGFPDWDPENPQRTELDRLWTLSEYLIGDLDTLLEVTASLADIVFGRFDQSEWPHRFIAGGEAIDWPTSPAWGQRLVTDAKILQLVVRLLSARRAGQKVVVFSQFSDTIAYVQSVLRACLHFSRTDWQVVVRGLGMENLKSDEVLQLLEVTSTVTGDTSDRDDVINAFAPYYRIGPVCPPCSDQDSEGAILRDAWQASWTLAIREPIDVLLATDVLAEGVNLQDAALVVNYDVHWNPVRMIQRAGRIDRRLNPRIERAGEFIDVAELATRLERPVPKYYWHEHANEAPATVNMILPDELEKQLLLRERIATKTLAIDFTLGLEQGTGAEADWMASYTYGGIAGLNSFQKDRAIECIAGHHERLGRSLTSAGIPLLLAETLQGWFAAANESSFGPVVARLVVRGYAGDENVHSRSLQPRSFGGVPAWVRTGDAGTSVLLDELIVLDGRSWPPRVVRAGEQALDASSPLRASDLLAVAESMAIEAWQERPSREFGRLVQQGMTAIAAGWYSGPEDYKVTNMLRYVVLQIPGTGRRAEAS